IVEISRHVQREAVAGDPAGDPDPDGGQFFASHPDPGEAVHAARRDPVVARGSYEHVLEIAHVAMDVAAVGIEIDDGVADELPWTVIRDVAAAAGLEDVHAARGERIGGGEDVRPTAIAANTERQHMRMLEQQQRVGDAASTALLDER